MDKENVAETIHVDLLNHAKESFKKYDHIFCCVDCSYDFSPTKMADSEDSAKPGEYVYSIRSGFGAICPKCGKKWLRDLKNRGITQEAVLDMVFRNLSPVLQRENSSAEYWRGKYEAYKEMEEKMKIIKASYEIMDKLDGAEILEKIERCGRVCYKSEDKITDESAEKFVRSIIKRGHESVLEHVSFSVRFIVDRGVSHEIVRHRLASYSQESTRFCNYSDGRFDGRITVIEPCFLTDEWDIDVWRQSCMESQRRYFELLKRGKSPQEARAVLPNSLKTELVMTANLREWRHFLRLRTSPAAHPQMREVTVPLLAELKEKIPVVFDDIEL